MSAAARPQNSAVGPPEPKTSAPISTFGNAPILVKRPDGRDVIVAGRNHGRGLGRSIQTRRGAVLGTRAGRGAALGGLEFGSAVEFDAGGLRRLGHVGHPRRTAWYKLLNRRACGYTQPRTPCAAPDAAAITRFSPPSVDPGRGVHRLKRRRCAATRPDGCGRCCGSSTRTDRPEHIVNGVPAKGASIGGLRSSDCWRYALPHQLGGAARSAGGLETCCWRSASSRSGGRVGSSGARWAGWGRSYLDLPTRSTHMARWIGWQPVRNRVALSPGAVWSAASPASAPTPRLLSASAKPTLSPDADALTVHAGDSVDRAREGGDAQRLTSGAVTETIRSSPGWPTIAFTGEYDGNADVVHTVPFARRRAASWPHVAPGADTALGVVSVTAEDPVRPTARAMWRVLQLYTMDVNGSFPEKLPLPWGWEAAYSPTARGWRDVPMRRAFSVWKRYRAATPPRSGLPRSPIRKSRRCRARIRTTTTRSGSPARCISSADRTGAVSSFSLRHAARSRRKEEVKNNTGFDFESIAYGADAIVVEQFGGLGCSISDDRHARRSRCASPEICRRSAPGMVNVSARSRTLTCRRTRRERCSRRAARL